jgi:hypothetical protein
MKGAPFSLSLREGRGEGARENRELLILDA